MTALLHTLTWATTVRDPKHMSPIEFAFTGALVVTLLFSMTVVVFS